MVYGHQPASFCQIRRSLKETLSSSLCHSPLRQRYSNSCLLPQSLQDPLHLTTINEVQRLYQRTESSGRGRCTVQHGPFIIPLYIFKSSNQKHLYPMVGVYFVHTNNSLLTTQVLLSGSDGINRKRGSFLPMTRLSQHTDKDTGAVTCGSTRYISCDFALLQPTVRRTDARSVPGSHFFPFATKSSQNVQTALPYMDKYVYISCHTCCTSKLVISSKFKVQSSRLCSMHMKT